MQTYGDLDLTETFRSYLYAFTQQTMGCWNTTNYGGRHMLSDADMGKVWTRLYPVAVKNIVDAEYRSAGDPEKTNIHAAVSIYKVYLLSLLTDIYGDIPYSEAGRGFIDGNPMPRYDTQQEILRGFLPDAGRGRLGNRDRQRPDYGRPHLRRRLRKMEETGQLAAPALRHAYLEGGPREGPRRI